MNNITVYVFEEDIPVGEGEVRWPSVKYCNFCNVGCGTRYVYERMEEMDKDQDNFRFYSLELPVDDALTEFCQYCGTFEHSSEYCRTHCTDMEAQEKFQTIGNATGYHVSTHSRIVLLIIPPYRSVELFKLGFSATMRKCVTDLKTKNMLIYGWDNPEMIESIQEEIFDPEIPPIHLEREMVVGRKFHIDSSFPECRTFVYQYVDRLDFPNKMWCPYDPRQDNTWFPVDQKYYAYSEKVHAYSCRDAGPRIGVSYSDLSQYNCNLDAHDD